MKKKLEKLLAKGWPYFLFLVCAFLLLSWQIVNKVTSQGVDTYFHFSRIYDASRQIRTGNWSLITNYSFDQAGRIVNAVYGPALAYFLGLLALVCHSWLRFQLVFALILYFAAGAGLYQVALRLTGKQILSTLAALCYIAFSPLTSWPTMASFQAVSAALAPWAVLFCVRMIENKDRPIDWLSLGAFMAAVAQMHLLDCLIFASVLFIFAIIGFVRTGHKKGMLLNLLGAVALFALLTVNVWLPVLHFMHTDVMATPSPWHLTESTWNLKLLYLYLSDTITVVFVAASAANLIYVLCHWKQSTVNNALALTGSFYLFAASSYFPWAAIEHALPVLRTSFQQPRRLDPIAIALLCASMALTWRQLNKKKAGRICGLTVLVMLLASGWGRSTNLIAYYTNLGVQNKQIVKAGRSRNMALLPQLIVKPYCDYLPNPHHKRPLAVREDYRQEVMLRNPLFAKKVLPHGRLELTWTARKAGQTRLPIVMYSESKLSKPVLRKSAIGVPTVREHKGSNSAVLSFKTPKSIVVSIYLALISWLALAIGAGWRRLTRHS